jgi:hypothetical protein
MIRRLLPGPHIAVDADIGQPVAGLRRQQQMVDPDAPVLLPGPGLVIPERVLARRVGHGAQRIGQSQAEQRLERLAGLREKQRVPRPCGGVIDVRCCRNDVEVAGQNERLFRFKSFPGVLKKPRHPFEFIGIFIGVGRIAVGQIEAGDAQYA